MSTEVKIGNYINITDNKRALSLLFSLPALAVMSYWSRCSLIANFISSYMAAAYPLQKNIASSLSFILNELLENAVKFVEPKESILEFALLQKGDILIINISNRISLSQVKPLIEVAGHLIDTDYSNTRFADLVGRGGIMRGKQGIGLLTIINYYQASLSFLISLPGEHEGHEKYSVQTKINIREL